jgi:hypothetical protein
MNNKKTRFWGIVIAVALTIVFSAAITGCGEDEISLPGNKKASDLPSFEGTAVKEDEAVALLSTLFSTTSGLFSNIRKAESDASDEAIQAAYSGDPSAYLMTQMSEKKATVSYNVNDSEQLKKNKFTSGTIKGSSKMSISSNVTFSEVMLAMISGKPENINLSSSDSNKRDIEFTGYENIVGTVYPQTYKASGFLHIEQNSNGKDAYKEKDKGDTSGKSTRKAALAVSFSYETTLYDGTKEIKGAKILISVMSENSSSESIRSIQKGSSNDVIISVKLFDNNNELICEKDNTSYATALYLDFASFGL